MTMAYPWNDESDFHTPKSKLGEFIIVTTEGEVTFVPASSAIVRVADLSPQELDEAVTLISKPPKARYEWVLRAQWRVRGKQ